MMDSRIAYDDFGGGGGGQRPQSAGFQEIVRRLIAQKLAGRQADPGGFAPLPGRRPEIMDQVPPSAFNPPPFTPGDGSPGDWMSRGGVVGKPFPMPAPGESPFARTTMPVPDEPVPMPEPQAPVKQFRPRPALRNRRFGGPSSMEF